MRFAVLLSAALLALAGSTQAQQLRTVPQSAAQVQLSFAPVVARVAPAVVNVYATRTVQARNPFANDPAFRQFFGGQPRLREQQSLGSGVIVEGNGIILTNNHVIQGAQDIRVALADRREFQAAVELSDPRTDLAVLRIDTRGETLPALEFGDSDRVQVGDLVLAIGDPFGVGQTVTSGIVSALARSNAGASDYQSFIQTDAAINPGNSGGALVTMDGKLIGINASIVSSSGGNVGIGFAIPSNMARRVVEGALGGGGMARPWFGAQVQTVTAELARSMGLQRPQGVLVSNIYPGSPAAAAGLVEGDVLLSIDGFEVNDPQGVNYRIATRRPGDTARFRYLHNGVSRDTMARVNVPPDTGRDEAVMAGRHPLQGVRVANITPALADDLQLDFSARGVIITDVETAAPAARFGFRRGDIVREVNGQDIDSVAQLRQMLTAAQLYDIVVQRGSQLLSLSL
jgi:serine protease Do